MNLCELQVAGRLVVLEGLTTHMCDEVFKLGIINLPLGKKSSSDNVVACQVVQG